MSKSLKELLGGKKSPEELRKSAHEMRVNAKRLEKEAAKLRAKRRNSETWNEERGGNKPYDAAQSGDIRFPMWYAPEGEEFAFGLRWRVVRDGDPKYRLSISVNLFEDVVYGLGKLAEKYAEEKRLPAEMRRELREYACVLKVVPDSVRAGIAEGQGPRANGEAPPNAKR